MQAILLLVLLAQQPDARGEVATREDKYSGQGASAPIPDKFHIRNEGGSDGSGLCVYASVVMAGATQGVADLAALKQSALWKHAKSRPGGSYPEKLAKDLNTVYPFERYGEKWQQYTGTDFGVLEKWSSEGRVVGSTMNTGALYNYQPIHHMIDVIGFKRGGYAGIVDNNEPGVRRWMPAKEFERRAIDGGTAWFFVWDKLPAAVRSLTTWVVVGMFALASVFVLWTNRRVLAFCVALCAFASVSQAQCPPGVVCPTPSNYMAPGGVYVMYPQVVQQQEQAKPAVIGTPDWSERYEEHVDPEGRRWLRARVTSGKHGKGSIWFRPDAWAEAEQKPDPNNFGIDTRQLQKEPQGSFISNDPSFDPNRHDTFSKVIPGQPEVSQSLGWFVMGVGLTAFGWFLFTFKRRAAR